MEKVIEPIAHIKSAYAEKFGVPRQSGLVPLEAEIVFTQKYKSEDALRGIEGFSHLWLIWGFSQNPPQEEFSPTVRPPRLGGNTRVGVFATRSPFRPNGLGLSCVKLLRVEGTRLFISGADMVDGTPIYDIKPYLAFTDSHPEASGGFAAGVFAHSLEVDFPPELLARLPESKQSAAIEVLAQDPRPSFQHDSERIYGFEFAGREIKFRVGGERLEVVDVL